MIWTRDHAFQPLRWIGARSFDIVDLTARPNLRPVRIKAGALGVNQPNAPLSVSRQHRILIRTALAQTMFGSNEVLVPACQFTDLPGIAVDMEVDRVTYYHLTFDAHEGVAIERRADRMVLSRPSLRGISPAVRAEIEEVVLELMIDE